MVFLVVSSSLPMTAPTVPIMPTLCPAASKMALTMWAVVVLPLVPVRPMTVIFSAGWLNHAADSSASAYRLS